MILILPSLGLFSASALLEWSINVANKNDTIKFECIFLPDRGDLLGRPHRALLKTNEQPLFEYFRRVFRQLYNHYELHWNSSRTDSIS